MRGTLDWTLLEVEGVEEAAHNAAKAVAKHEDYAEYVEFDDLRQEALILAAGMSRDVQMVQEDIIGLGALKHRIEMDLIDKVKYDVRHRQDHESYEARYDTDAVGDDYAPRPVSMGIRPDTTAYDRPLVETLLPAVWDESYCYGIRMENAPDQDMPRGSINKATGNTLAAHIADIKTGWKKAPLTLKERRALLLGYGFDWKVTEIAFNQGCTKQTISERIERGVGKIVNTLNGVDDAAWYTEDDQ